MNVENLDYSLKNTVLIFIIITLVSNLANYIAFNVLLLTCQAYHSQHKIIYESLFFIDFIIILVS